MNLLALARGAVVLAVELYDEVRRERRRARAANQPAAGMTHADSERLAALTRAAGRCPRCQVVHPSDRPCAGVLGGQNQSPAARAR